MNWYQELLEEMRGDIDNSTEEIDAISEELIGYAENPELSKLGACIVACQDASRAYGLRGAFGVLSSKVGGWSDILYSYSFLAESVRGRSVVRFANGTSLDNDSISELLLASVVFDKDTSKRRLLDFISDPSRFGLTVDHSDSEFAMFGDAFASAIGGSASSLNHANAFAVLLEASSLEEFLKSLSQYENTRMRLSQDAEEEYQHFENPPIAILPLEVLAVVKLRGWDISAYQNRIPPCFATPLMEPPPRIVNEENATLNAAKTFLDCLAAASLSFE